MKEWLYITSLILNSTSYRMIYLQIWSLLHGTSSSLVLCCVTLSMT
ncbi:hypothetical protein Gotur_003812 [Gossypium turneri]